MINYTTDQQATIDEFVAFMLDPNRKVLVINGRPGCGKTFLVSSLIQQAKDISSLLTSLLGNNQQLSFHLAATTNQAAEVLAEKTGMEATTIHSFLGLRVQNDYKTGKTQLMQTNSWKVHESVILFIDEMSMADTELISFIDKATMNCKVVFILDKNQVLPVFETEIPLIKKYPVNCNLTQIVRQGAGNPIIDYAHELCDAIENNTLIPAIPASSNIIHLSASEFKQELDAHFTLPDAEHRFKILGWTNKRVRKYNQYIRGLMFPDELIRAGEYLVANDTYVGAGGLTIIRNQEEVLVTQASALITCSETDIQYQSLRVKGNSGHTYLINRPIDYDNVAAWLKYYGKTKEFSKLFDMKQNMLDLRPLHACTVHKSQGSTYEDVFIDLDDICANNKINEVKRLILVGITRAANKVYLRGSIPSKYSL